jgi:hypothetical protein
MADVSGVRYHHFEVEVIKEFDGADNVQFFV